MRAVNEDPPMQPIFSEYYHLQSDELLGSWLLLLSCVRGQSRVLGGPGDLLRDGVRLLSVCDVLLPLGQGKGGCFDDVRCSKPVTFRTRAPYVCVQSTVVHFRILLF
jgi:hypothetical protein